jgi:hypothetical protein
MEKILQGHSFDFSVNAAPFGAIDGIEINIFANNTIAQKFKHPDTEGFAKLTKTGDLYEGVLTSVMTDSILGRYGIEVIAIIEDQEKKGENKEFIEVTQKPV